MFQYTRHLSPRTLATRISYPVPDFLRSRSLHSSPDTLSEREIEVWITARQDILASTGRGLTNAYPDTQSLSHETKEGDIPMAIVNNKGVVAFRLRWPIRDWVGTFLKA